MTLPSPLLPPTPPDAVASATEPSQALLDALYGWSRQHGLRQLDSALPRFLLQLDPQAAPVVLLAAALLSQMEGRGHTCVPLATLRQPWRPEIDWPLDVRADLQELWSLWWPRTALQPLFPVEESVHAHTAADLAQLRTSPLVRCVWPGSHQPDHGQPLVLGGTPAQPLLYLRRYWVYEQQVAHAIAQRLQVPPSGAASADAVCAVDTARARAWLDRLFPAPVPGTSPNAGSDDAEPDWQKVACAVALRAPLTVITGGPGTGKTYTAARLLALLLAMDSHPQRLRVALAAPTGKAAARLSQSIQGSLVQLQHALNSVGTGADGTTHSPEAAPDLAALTTRIGKAKTVHALLGASQRTRQFRHHAANPLDVDVLIVDETSMIHLEMMAALLQALPATARLIVLGDKDQLASVEAGAVLGDLCTYAQAGHYSADTVAYIHAVTGQRLPAPYHHPGASPAPALAQQTVMLRRSRRFVGAIGTLAQAVNTGGVTPALLQRAIGQSADVSTVWLAPQHGPQAPLCVAALAAGQPGAHPYAPQGYRTYLELAASPPAGVGLDAALHQRWVLDVLKSFDRFRILCAVHDGECGDRALNLRVQQALQQARLLQSSGEWFVGRPVMVTRNDAALGVFNGDVGVVLPAFSQPKLLRAYFLDGDTARSVAVSRLAHAETAFAMTVHKSQGSEFEHTVLVLPDSVGQVVSRQLVYTGITRARKHFSLVQARGDALLKAVAAPAYRASGLAGVLAQLGA